MSKNKSKNKNQAGKARGGAKSKSFEFDRHLLYSAAVQSVEADLDFFQRIYRKERGKRFELLREDFCGTAALACEWVRRRKANRAWGVDLDRDTLDWGIRRYVPVLGDAADRLELQCRNVLDWQEPHVDVVAALNFSFNALQTRAELRSYFEVVRRSMLADGIFFLDVFGGTDATHEEKESRRIPSSVAFDGTKIPAFKYLWEQKKFNPVNHGVTCTIGFKLPGDKKKRKAFRYDWRLWTLPEIREVLIEAGFERVDVYVEGWDDDHDESDGVFRKRSYFENQSGWVGYVVGLV